MLSTKKMKLEYLPLPGAGVTSTVVNRHVRRSFLEPFIGKVYTKYRIAGDNQEAYYLLEPVFLVGKKVPVLVPRSCPVVHLKPGPTSKRFSRRWPQRLMMGHLAVTGWGRMALDIM